MGINKVIYNGQVLIDLTSSTVTPETLLEGVVAFNSSGDKIVGTLVIFGGYINQVPISIDTDGNVYNSVGYIDGYRLSSSGSLSQQANTVTTGFIPCKSTDTIRMGGVKWLDSKATNVIYNYIAFYDTSFNLLGSLNISSPSGTRSHRGIVTASSSVTTDDNGVTTFNIVFTDGSEVAYCRVNGYGNGSDMIVTINEAIVEKPYTYTNQVPLSINEDGTIYNLVGFKNGYRVRSGGTEAEYPNGACTGFIPVKPNDIIRLKGWDMKVNSTANCINISDSSFTNLGQWSSNNVQGYGSLAGTPYAKPGAMIEEGNGVYKWQVPPAEFNTSYIRVSGQTGGMGTGMIVTVNEEIK